MDQLSDLENKILSHCFEQGYKYAAFNGNHVRLFDLDEKPILKGGMYRVEVAGTTHFGVRLFVPNLFENVGNKVINLREVVYQESLF